MGVDGGLRASGTHLLTNQCNIGKAGVGVGGVGLAECAARLSALSCCWVRQRRSQMDAELFSITNMSLIIID